MATFGALALDLLQDAAVLESVKDEPFGSPAMRAFLDTPCARRRLARMGSGRKDGQLETEQKD